MANLAKDLATNTARNLATDLAIGTPASILSDAGFWHRADLGLTFGVEPKILRQADMAGTFNIDVEQLTTDEQPVLFSSGGLNNQAYLSFDGVDDNLTFSGTNMKSTTEFYMAVVCRFPSTPVNVDRVLDIVNTGGVSVVTIRNISVVQFQAFVRNDISAIATATVAEVFSTDWHLAETWWDGSNVSASMDGGPVVSAALTGTVDFSNAPDGGYARVGAPPLDMAEGIFSFKNSVANGERTKLLAYFNKRYQQGWT